MNDKKDIKQLAEELYFEARKHGLLLREISFNDNGRDLNNFYHQVRIKIDAELIEIK